ncbi:MAG: DNA-processing protein DprA [Myxococcales bacterium]|nr:DNA-processing protein DprA [Myxococcales bacterium]
MHPSAANTSEAAPTTTSDTALGRREACPGLCATTQATYCVDSSVINKSSLVQPRSVARHDDEETGEMPTPTRCLSPGDVDYPPQLASLTEFDGGIAPPIYMRGQLPLEAAIAVIGTRRCTPEAAQWTEQAVRVLVAAGLSIGSGGARGIDAVAHRAALDAGGRTFVVTTGSLADPYPPEHAELYARVLQARGAVLSLEPDGAERTMAQFLRRNHVLAALCRATLVVEAPHRSGSRHTARVAHGLGRLVMSVPHAPWSPRGAGCAQLLRKGAVLVTSAEDVLDALSLPLPTRLVRRAARGNAKARGGRTLESRTLENAKRGDAETPAGRTLRGTSLATLVARAPHPDCDLAGEVVELHDRDCDALEPWLEAILNVVTPEPSHLDAVCERAGVSARIAQRALLQLCLVGVVTEAPEGQFRRNVRSERRTKR